MFGIPNDRIGAEEFQILRLLPRRHPGQAPDGRRSAGAALVEHEHAIIAQGSLEPAGFFRGEWTRRFVTGTALKEDEERTVLTFDVGNLACKDANRSALRLRMVERQRELVIRDRKPRDTVRPCAALGFHGDAAAPFMRN